jgi:hypothetical protein
MTSALQLLVFVAAIAGLIAFGFYRDKKEHAMPPATQTSIYFPEHHQQDEERQQGAAMSRLS